MFESALKYKYTCDMLALNDKNYKSCPSNEKWKKGEQICEFFMPFHNITNLIFSTNYLIDNLYFIQDSKFELLLLNHLNEEIRVLKDITFHIKKIFDKF